jgi:parvulin-like peptidyl-prolyl isomerase
MTARLLLPVVLIAALAAGCGSGGGSSLAAGDVAVVGGTHIMKAQFDTLMHEAKINLTAQGQTFPKAGTTQYSGIRSQAVGLLVAEAEKEAEATKLGLSVTAKDIQKRLDQIKKQYFSGSDAKYQAAVKKQGLTDAEVRNNIRSQLISQKLFDSLTKKITVTPTAVLEYYSQHLSEYQTAASRSVRYILVGKNKSSLAQTLYQQLNGAPDATWCTLVKKYSQDAGSKATCGKSTFTKGQTVAEFDKLAFSLDTKTVAKLNTTQYGWFVLQPTAAITPAKKTPVATVTKTIKTQLLKDKKDAFMTAWVDKIKTKYCKDSVIKYQAGYKPSPDPCTVTSTATTATTTP